MPDDRAHHMATFMCIQCSYAAAKSNSGDGAGHLTRLLGKIISQNRGAIVGDSDEDGFVMASFPNASLALSVALTAHENIASESLSSCKHPDVRMGLDAAEIVMIGQETDRTHTRCQRLMELAYSGQILVSSAIEAALHEGAPSGVSFLPLGWHRLTDLQPAQQVYQVLHPLLPTSLPPLKSLHAYPHNLPLQFTRFIGRTAELNRAKRLLQTTRLLTITGPGGCGKTRLALQTAAERMGAHADGIWVIELAQVSLPLAVLETIAAVLRIDTAPDSLLERIVDFLQSREVLIILDNAEHLIGECAEVVHQLLGRCPGVQVIVTSRESLGISGECVWTLQPLKYPGPHHLYPLDTIARWEAVQLFEARARAVLPHFAVVDQNARAVADICRVLDGNPLAIELAAARIRVLTVQKIAERLSDCNELLVSRNRLTPSRQQTMRGTIAWSYNLLTDDERELWRRLSVFSGWLVLEAAEAVCAGNGIPSGNILNLLSSLADKSVVAVDVAGGERRYRLSEAIRQYGAAQLRVAQSEVWPRQHRDWYLKQAEDMEDRLCSRDQVSCLDELEHEYQNMLAALVWSSEQGEWRMGLQLATAIGRFWLVRDHKRDGIGWLDVLLAHAGKADPCLWVRGSILSGILAQRAGLSWPLSSRYGEVQMLCTDLGDKHGLALSLTGLAAAAAQGAEFDAARRLIAHSLGLFRELGDKVGLARALLVQGSYAQALDERMAARTAYDESLAISQSLEDTWSIAQALLHLGQLALVQKDSEPAMAYYRESLRHSRLLGDRLGMLYCLIGLAHACYDVGNELDAVRLFGMAMNLFDHVSMLGANVQDVACDPVLVMLRGRIGQPVFQRVLAEGRTMPLDQSALVQPQSFSPQDLADASAMGATCCKAVRSREITGSPSGLTGRELEIVALIAQSLTAKEIADKLVLSRRTVERHEENIRVKINVHNRMGIVAWAIRNGIADRDSLGSAPSFGRFTAV